MGQRSQRLLGVMEPLLKSLANQSHLNDVALPLVTVIRKKHEEFLFVPHFLNDARDRNDAGLFGAEETFSA